MNQPPIYQHPELDGRDFFWKGSSVGVLLIHGFTATSVEVRGLATHLHQAGYTVAGPLLPGHGTSPEEMNRYSWKDWAEAAEQQLQLLKKDCSTVFIGGESMGGVLSTWLAARHPELAGILLFAPAFRTPGIWKTVFYAPFKEYIWKANTDDSMPWQGYNVIPLKAAAQLFWLQFSAKREIRKINQPVFLALGAHDRTIDREAALSAYNSFPSQIKEIHTMEASGHVILLDKEKQVANLLVENFIRSVTTGRS